MYIYIYIYQNKETETKYREFYEIHPDEKQIHLFDRTVLIIGNLGYIQSQNITNEQENRLKEVEFSSRSIIKRQLYRLEDKLGITPEFSCKLDFTVFEEPIEIIAAENYSKLIPFGKNSNCALQHPSDKLLNLFPAIIQTLLNSGIPAISCEIGNKSGQYTLTLGSLNPLELADAILLSKMVYIYIYINIYIYIYLGSF